MSEEGGEQARTRKLCASDFFFFFYLFSYLSGGALMGATPEHPWNRAGKKLMEKKKIKKESSIPLRCLSVSLPSPPQYWKAHQDLSSL